MKFRFFKAQFSGVFSQELLCPIFSSPCPSEGSRWVKSCQAQIAEKECKVLTIYLQGSRWVNHQKLNLSLKPRFNPTTLQVGAHKRNVNPSFEPGLHPIDTISYGVQDLVYTRCVFCLYKECFWEAWTMFFCHRVFAMIVVKDAPELRGDGGTRRHPFECLAFVCDSRQTARRLTFALANAFQVGFVSSSVWWNQNISGLVLLRCKFNVLICLQICRFSRRR